MTTALALLLACAPSARTADVQDTARMDDTGTPGNGVFALAAGGFHTCALLDGYPSCWGGSGAMDHAQASPPPALFDGLVAGLTHTCALQGEEATCWGNDAYGQASPPLGPRFSALAAGDYHSCGITIDGLAICWGSDDFGQSSPPDGPFIAIAAGRTHTCALQSDGHPTCWGSLTTAPDRAFVTLGAGTDYACGLDPIGEVACWVDVEPRIYDIAVLSLPALAVASGSKHVCALLENNRVTCAGNDDAGQLASPATPFTHVTAGSQHSCAMDAQNTVRCWGDDSFDQIP